MAVANHTVVFTSTTLDEYNVVLAKVTAAKLVDFINPIASISTNLSQKEITGIYVPQTVIP